MVNANLPNALIELVCLSTENGFVLRNGMMTAPFTDMMDTVWLVRTIKKLPRSENVK